MVCKNLSCDMKVFKAPDLLLDSLAHYISLDGYLAVIPYVAMVSSFKKGNEFQCKQPQLEDESMDPRAKQNHSRTSHTFYACQVLRKCYTKPLCNSTKIAQSKSRQNASLFEIKYTERLPKCWEVVTIVITETYKIAM